MKQSKPSHGPFSIAARISRFTLSLLLPFFLGFVVAKTRIFPYGVVDEFWYTLNSDRDGISFFKQALHDLSLRPTRFLVNYKDETKTEWTVVSGLPLRGRRGPVLLRFKTATSALSPGEHLFASGVFDFEQGLHGAILVDHLGRAVHHWSMTQEGLSWDVRSDLHILPHGVEILPDGSLIAAFDKGQSLQRVDRCGNLLWARKGGFHHSVSLDGSSAWVWNDERLSRIDVGTGRRLSSFGLNDIARANEPLDLFGVRQNDLARHSIDTRDPVHPNDIEPLPARLADRFPMFEAGDLLVSLRNVNLVFVVDPDTLKVKWWRSSAWRRQHDPDWSDDGRILVYDNNMHRGFSRIVAIDPATMDTETLVDGAEIDFYSAIRGKQQWLPSGALVLTIPQQGRALEIDPNGEVRLELINQFDPDTGENLVLTDVQRIPQDFFDAEFWDPCP